MVKEYCFNTLDASTSKARVDHLRKNLKKLFDVYKKNPTKTAAGSSKSNNMEQNILPGYGDFYAFISQTVGANGKSALDKYLDEPVLDMMTFKSLDVLKYWKDNANRFQELSSMACDILSIPITTVASESSFSIGSRVLSKYRSSLLPSNVQALICARNWLKGFEEIVDPFEEGKEGEREGEGV
ncbi:PREDICTED: zinc finger BED domain-containing protein DAYSLEEPER-like [Camelina sativa]|uniref:Zinc finger BED domain-containing protein DAYSLEEPER-like n=1 Tax=Camelina sativa TaxID=90675 RepID=A0ABM0YWU6_CAMSA|nr:PREDICTED: zinc finger BED domain-containing protein DAYSLEEPER-like [Camelina sativa]